jgi:hypothetical protein
MLPISDGAPADFARHRGPSLVGVAITFVVLFTASLVLSGAMAGGEHFPSPFQSPDVSVRFFAEHAMAMQVMATLQFGAAVPLGIFAASTASRVQFLGRKVAGINIAFFGGMAASFALTLSSFGEWVLSQPGVIESAATVRALHLFCFAAGGPGYVVPFGLLVAGISLVAGIQRFIPRWLMWFGLLIAAVAELSTLALVVPAAAYLLPLARFPGFVWMIVVGAMLPTAKGALRARDAAPAVLENAPQSVRMSRR